MAGIAAEIAQWARWIRHREALDLTPCHREVFMNLTNHAFSRGYPQPNLLNPQTYQDYISWLMLFDQEESRIKLVDKLGSRAFISETVGDQWCPQLLWVGGAEPLKVLESLPAPYVLKTNHDSGSVIIVKGDSPEERERAMSRLQQSHTKEYGWEKGEWPYRFVERKIFAEDYVGSPRELVNGVPSIRFHCVSGRITWLQLIRSGPGGLTEVAADPTGRPLPFPFSRTASPVAAEDFPRGWESLIEPVEALAKGFRYVRIDSLVGAEGHFIGEFTFFPLAGLIRKGSNRFFGELMSFNTSVSSRLPPISCREAPHRPVNPVI